MGYMHIGNLYRDRTIFLFKECYVTEKVHGTSAHIRFDTTWASKAHVEGCNGEVREMDDETESVSVNPCNCPSKDETKVKFHSGGESYERFKALFGTVLEENFKKLGHLSVTVYGEAYGGKCQGMSATYGKDLRFIAFDVQVGDTWLSLPDAEDVCNKLGIEFVPYAKVSTDLVTLDAWRDMPSRVAERRGCGTNQIAEGIVIRPLLEFTLNNGERVIVKHKRPEFSERASKRDTNIDPAKAEVLAAADKIAQEWVTPMRLEHVLDKIQAEKGTNLDLSDTPKVLRAMVEDVYREAGNEIVQSKEANRAISAVASKLFQAKVKGNIS